MRDLSQELDEKQLKWILSQLQEIDLNYYGDSEVEEVEDIVKYAGLNDLHWDELGFFIKLVEMNPNYETEPIRVPKLKTVDVFMSVDLTEYVIEKWRHTIHTYLDKNKPQIWWDQNNANSNTIINQSQYNSLLGNGPFFYNDFLVSGDTIDGDFCEWNNYEQLERVISEYQHKITYNNIWFTLSATTQDYYNSYGYFYQPHKAIQIRSFSDYIEEGDSLNVVGIPDYSYYSTTNALFRWKDLYPYGFIDTDGIGVDYPYLNDSHYPFLNSIFRITPETYNIPSDYGLSGAVPININTIPEPIVDECE